MVTYQPGIVRKFADNLEKQADATVLVYTVLGAVLGAAVIAFIGPSVLGSGRSASEGSSAFALGGAVLGAVLGLAIGTSAAFKWRLMAQLTLCFAEIEANTRAASISLEQSRKASGA